MGSFPLTASSTDGPSQQHAKGRHPSSDQVVEVIEIPEERISMEVTKRLQDLTRQVRLPGFRPGKVPMKEVRRRYGPSVRAEVAGELMQSSFFDAIREEDLIPAGSPSLEVERW